MPGYRSADDPPSLTNYMSNFTTVVLGLNEKDEADQEVAHPLELQKGHSVGQMVAVIRKLNLTKKIK